MYQQASGYWRTSPRHVLLWAVIGVLDRIERQVPEERLLRSFAARLRRIIDRPVTRDTAVRWWRRAAGTAKAAEPDRPPDELFDRAISAIVEDLAKQIITLRRTAVRTVEQRLQVGLPAELREQAIQEAFEFVRGIPDTLRHELRQLARETMAEYRTQFDFARELRRRWAQFSRDRAEMIARTEWAHVAGRATLELYRQQGTRRKIWYTVADPQVCPVCQGNAAIGPIPIDQPFPSGVQTVPAHPRCRCNIAGALE